MTIVVAQHARRGDAEATVQAVLGDLESRVTAAASFIVLPENVFTSGDGICELAPKLRDQCLERLADLARTRQAYVLTGSWPETADAGGLAQVTRLLDPRGSVSAEVRRAVHADGTTGTGDDFPVVDTAFGRVGILLGTDFWLVEPPRIQCLDGAELLLVAGSLDGRNQAAQRSAVWGIATLNTVAVAFASSLGPRSGGHSAVAGPEGFLARAEMEECVLEADCDLAHIRYLREPDLRFQQTLWFGLWARRPHLYAPLVDGPSQDNDRAGKRERVS